MSKSISQNEARAWRKRARAAERTMNQLLRGWNAETESHWLAKRVIVPEGVATQIGTAINLGFTVEVELRGLHGDEMHMRAIRRKENRQP